MKRPFARAIASLLLLFGVTAAQAQLNEKCTVSVLNRNAQASADGSWIVPTIPANFGPVRARATCVVNGVTKSGESTLFTIAPNSSINVPPIQLGQTTPIPSLLTLTAPLTTLSAEGASTTLTVVASYNDGSTRNVSGSNGNTVYLISNPAIATITAEGVVRAVASGTAVVQATHEGASGLLAVNVVLSADSDGDGILDDVELREGLDPNNPTDALEDFDRDGLSNLREVNAGTQLRVADTDGDTLKDGEEANAGADGFVTSPLLPDTDADGLRDALEVETGSDPTNASSYNLAAALTRIEATPPAFTLIVNTFQPEAFTQLNVIGRLRDGFSIDLTSTSRGTNYSSSNVNVLNFGLPDGRVYAGSQGTANVTVSNSGFTALVAGSVRSFTPRTLARLDIPGFANNVDIGDGYAYVAAGSAGLHVVDIADPAAPRIIGTRDTNGNANDVRVVGRYAYVADGNAGLKIIDVDNPAAPVIVGSVDTPGEANDVAVADNVAYIADGYSGLTIVNVASPNAPIVVATIDTPGYARGVDVSNGFAYVVDESPSTLRAFAVSNPAAPALRGTVSLAGELKDIRVNGTYAYVAAYTGGMHVVNVANPAAPVRIGGLPGSAPLGFIPMDVEVTQRLALVAEVLFVNAVPAVDITNRAAPILRGVLDFQNLGDYNGTGIAIAGPYVYMTGSWSIQDNGTNDSTALFIGQFLPLEDLAGVAPEVTITSPVAGATYLEGTPLTITATATDDIAVSLVTFAVNDQVVFTDSSAPYEYALDLPATPGPINITVAAADLAGNIGQHTVGISVIPDPLTTVAGIVVDETGTPLVGATVTTLGQRTATTGTGGAFSIYGVPTVRGEIVASALYTKPDGTLLGGSSAPFAPVRNGVTNVGTIAAVAAQWESNFGTFLSSCDDCFFEKTLPFPFTFYGTTRTVGHVGTNGYITFESGDWEYVENLPSFNNRPRIAAFFDDLYGRSTGATYVNDTLPGRFVVTYDRVQHYSFGGSNTLQITLYSDGRILFGYRGITALTTGSITGITPGPNSPYEQVDYTARPAIDLAPGIAVYEYFTNTNRFDLDYSFVLFTPRPDGSYNVRTIVAPPPAAQLTLTGDPAGSNAGALRTTSNGVATQSNGVFGKAEIEVLSSVDPNYRGMTNTDSRGHFELQGVPPGGVVVTVKKKDKIIGQGSAVVRGNSGKAHVDVDHPRNDKKERPNN